MNQSKLKQLLIEYYRNYYRDLLGLPDWRQRVKERLVEEKPNSFYSASKNLQLIESLVNFRFDGKKVLVVGAGTGVETTALNQKGCQIFAIEPEKKAREILKLRGFKNIKNAVAEKIPYDDNSFDLIYCWQVLEHVQNVALSIKEMVRTVKKGGYIFIGCPDYRQIAEPHYKLFLPLFLPRWVNKTILRLRGKNPAFFDTLQLVTAKKIKNILRGLPVIATQIINRGAAGRLITWIRDNYEIEPSQYWLIKKL